MGERLECGILGTARAGASQPATDAACRGPGAVAPVLGIMNFLWYLDRAFAMMPPRECGGPQPNERRRASARHRATRIPRSSPFERSPVDGPTRAPHPLRSRREYQGDRSALGERLVGNRHGSSPVFPARNSTSSRSTSSNTTTSSRLTTSVRSTTSRRSSSSPDRGSGTGSVTCCTASAVSAKSRRCCAGPPAWSCSGRRT